MNNEDFRIYSRKELLTNWRNQLFDAVIKSEINLKFHIMQSKLLKKGSPDQITADAQIKRTEQVVADSNKKLELVDNELSNLK